MQEAYYNDDAGAEAPAIECVTMAVFAAAVAAVLLLALGPHALRAQSVGAARMMELEWLKPMGALDAVVLDGRYVGTVMGNPSDELVYRLLDQDGNELLARTRFEPPLTVWSRAYALGPTGLVAADTAWYSAGCPSTEMESGAPCTRLFAAYDRKGDLRATAFWSPRSPDAMLEAMAVAGDEAGDVFVAARVRGSLDLDLDGEADVVADTTEETLVARFGVHGQVKWHTQLPAYILSSVRQIEPGRNDFVYLSGGRHTAVPWEREDVVVQLDAHGTLNWSVASYAGREIAASARGGALLLSSPGTPVPPPGDLFVVLHVDEDGVMDTLAQVVGLTNLGNPSCGEGYSVAESAGGDTLYVAAAFLGNIDLDGDGESDLSRPRAYSCSEGLFDAFIAAYARDGRLLGKADIASSSPFIRPRLLRAARSGRVLLAGQGNDRGDFNGDGVWDIETDEPLIFHFVAMYALPDATVVEPRPGQLDFVDVDVYPLPASGRVQFRLSVPRPERLRLEIFDTMGRRLALVAEDDFLAGTTTIDWMASALAAGIYLYRVSAEGHTVSGTLSLVR